MIHFLTECPNLITMLFSTGTIALLSLHSANATANFPEKTPMQLLFAYLAI